MREKYCWLAENKRLKAQATRLTAFIVSTVLDAAVNPGPIEGPRRPVAGNSTTAGQATVLCCSLRYPIVPLIPIVLFELISFSLSEWNKIFAIPESPT
jgi:hypothetical protein